MPYIGNQHNVGDHVNNFKVLDDISSHTATFDGSATSVVSAADDTIRIPEHRFIQGQRVTYTNGGGGNIGGLTTGTAYFISFDTANTIKLATTLANANSNTVINLSAVGSGTSHTLNAAFDGVNTKFKVSYSNGKAARFNNATQLNVAINNVVQRPNINSVSFTEGFAIEDNHKIVFKTAPTVNDVFWGSIIANTIENFDLHDNEVDNFTGDGSTTEFTLSTIPANNESVIVSINGVVQHPSDKNTARSYTLIDSIIQFTAAPALGDGIQVRHIGFAGASTADVSGFYGRTGNVVLTSSDHITTGDITSRNINSSGIITATTFDGAFSSGVGGSNANFTGIVTAGVFKGGDIEGRNLKITGLSTFVGDASFTGNVSIGGTLTYEDVTNIDSVGIITARSNIDCNGSLDVDGHTNLDNVNIAGVTTTSGSIVIENAEPSLFLTDTNGNPDYKIFNDAGAFKIYDTTYSATRLQIGPSNGEVTIQSNTNFPNGVTMNPGTASVVNTIAQKIGDTDTKIRFPAADTFSVETAGSERLRITSEGKLGINYNSPVTMIHAIGNNVVGTSVTMTLQSHDTVNATAGIDLLARNNSNVNRTSKILATSGGSGGNNSVDLTFHTNNTEQLRIRENGLVGIRTDNPGRELDVYKGTGNDCTIVARVKTAGAWFEANSETSSGYYGLKLRNGNTEKWFLGSYGSNNLQLKTATANASSLLEVTSAGKIGIGNVTSPDNNVEIRTDAHGEGILIKSTGNTSNAVTFDANRGTQGVIGVVYGRWNGTTVGQMSFVSGDDGTDKNDGYITFGTESAASNGNVNATERLRITSTGQIGIGTATVRNSRAMQLTGESNSLFLITGHAPSVCLNRDPDDSSDADRSFFGVSSVSNGFANGTAAGDTILRGNSSGKIIFAISTSIKMHLTSAGDLNIGTVGRFDSSGIVKTAHGSESAPSHTFLNDPDNGMYRPTTNTLGFVCGGDEKLRIDSSGNILTSGNTQLFGSNTSDGSDNKAIMINGGGAVSDSRGGYLLVHGNEHSSFPGITRLHAGNVGTAYIAFNTAGSERLRINSAGNMGVGVTDPDQKLEVDGIIKGSSYFQAGASGTASYNWHFGAEGNGQFRIYSGNYGAGNEKLRIDADGVIYTGDYGTRLDSTPGSVQINGGSGGGRLSLRGTTTSAYGGLGEMHGFWDTNKVASILFHAGSDTTNKDDGEIRMYTRLSGGASAQRFRIQSNGNVIFGSGDTYASNSVSIHPSSGMVNFGMDGRDALITGENSCYIYSGSGASGAMPAGTLVLQSRANVNRNILFATGDTPSLKWHIHGSTGALQEYPYNTSTSSQSTGNGQAYHLRRVRNGQVPNSMNSSSTYTLFNTNEIGDAGAYIIIIRSFEQSQTGGVLWSVRIVSSVFYLHSGTGNDGETVTIPVTHSGHANNASNPPVTLKIHFYGGSAHTHGRISITPNGFNYSGSNCDYYVYKLIDV